MNKKDEPPPPFFVVPLAANPKHHCGPCIPANYVARCNIAAVSAKCTIGRKEDIEENVED